ncbi:aspartate carbamoyltransferase regulatory subunit [candidate division KSB1 bacterium]
MRPYKVYAIEAGVVIDHIPPKKALDVVNVLKAMEGDSVVTLGVNLESEKGNRKDVVKIERKELSREDLMKIALIAPKATVNIIKDHEVSEKLNIAVPLVFENIIKCPNPNCITNKEIVESKFHTVSAQPLMIKCHFCERTFERDEVSLL